MHNLIKEYSIFPVNILCNTCTYILRFSFLVSQLVKKKPFEKKCTKLLKNTKLQSVKNNLDIFFEIRDHRSCQVWCWEQNIPRSLPVARQLHCSVFQNMSILAKTMTTGHRVHIKFCFSRTWERLFLCERCIPTQWITDNLTGCLQEFETVISPSRALSLGPNFL